MNMFHNTDIENALDQERTAQHAADNLLSELKEQLHQEAGIDDRLNGKVPGNNHFNVDLLEADNVYTIKEIRKICITYRLRFLKSELFKGEIPKEAKDKIKALNADPDTDIKNFRIIAPAKRFILEDGDTDPILFAELGNGYYYKIHKWGADMTWWQRVKAIPFRSFGNLMTTVLMTALLFTFITPNGLVTTDPSAGYFNDYRLILFPWYLMVFSAITAFVWFTFNKNLSEYEWNSRYLKN